MDITLEKVEESKKNVLYRLLQYSLFEESLSDQNDMNEDALFEYPCGLKITLRKKEEMPVL